MAEHSDLDAFIAARTKQNPEFPRLLEAAATRRALARDLTQRRKELGLSQTEVARRMHTSQPAIARLEKAEADVKISSFERYAATLGCHLAFVLEQDEDAALAGV